MSPVHDALRRAGMTGAATAAAQTIDNDFLSRVRAVACRPSPDALIIDPQRPRAAPIEEFRALRTRLNHMQSRQPIHTLVFTSAAPAEGKSLAASNLALAEAQLSGNLTLLCDFDFRRPVIHNLFQMDRSPGITDYLRGKIALYDAIRRIGDTNLYVMPAGEPVPNPLELLNLPEVRQMLDQLPALFNWIILDSPPLLFAADGNLLASMCHGAILVVRIGATTRDSVARAMQSLCQNNVIGMVVNGVRRGELYSKYAYYHSYDSPDQA
ncbi:MAG TPA: CpsD/CapB family tyrosine-protein kinase [Bryobacteraceae bacterium]|nr:CpsD/CapB family tyrosine-protein kinase [Bryobacteraceae bacterium]